MIFTGRALKLEKVSTFTIHVDPYHPLQQTKKQFQCLNKPLFLEFINVKKVLAFQKGGKWCDTDPLILRGGGMAERLER